MQDACFHGKKCWTDVTGVILAGGRSMRMGRDKASLQVEGVSLFSRAKTLLRGFFPRVIIAGDRPDLAEENLPCFPDPFPGSALGGLYTGLLHAETPWIFSLPCDLPFADSEMVQAVLLARESWDVVVPRPPSGPEPLFGLYSRKCLPFMRRQLESGRYRIVDFYGNVRVRYLEPAELPPGWERALCNLNTSEDYRRIVGENRGN
jgi:molybdopterin-guanine dinucleotide biosynthesis protein A